MKVRKGVDGNIGWKGEAKKEKKCEAGGRKEGGRVGEEQEACGGQCEVSTIDIQDETNGVCQEQAGEGGNVYSRHERVGRNDLVWYLWAQTQESLERTNHPPRD